VSLEGQCINPFEVDTSADIAICEKAEKGYIEMHYRDWCYWYAAYSKGDTTICASIEWEKMINACERGGNPDDYDVKWIIY